MNEEINYKDCVNASIRLPTSDDDLCQLQNTSCLFLSSFPESVSFESYETYEQGFSQLKRGKVIAFLYIKANFSGSINSFIESAVDHLSLTQSNIETFVDKSRQIPANDIISKIILANEQFAPLVLHACNHSSEYLKSPLTFEKPMFGSYWDAKSFLAHSLITGYDS